MAQNVLLTVIVAVFVTTVHATVGWDECNHTFVDHYDPPHYPTRTAKVCRDKYLAIAFDIEMKVPAYSAYHVTPEEVQSIVPGRDSFYEDPDLKAMGVEQARVNSDAFNSSWNRGHLAPNHIMSTDKGTKHACFTMANVAPQAGYFNQQPWNQLEADVFDWIKTHDALHVVTGVAYFDRSRPERTYDNIAVPDFYFKVLCNPKNHQAVGFYGHNKLGYGDECKTKRTVEEVEKLYGGRLLPERYCRKDYVDAAYWW